jgi:hypothetical protein
MKKLLCFIAFSLWFINGFSQEPNIFFSEPHHIQSFLKHKYSAIELKAVREAYPGGFDGLNEKKILEHTRIEFVSDTVISVITFGRKDEPNDTIKYVYDQCKNLVAVRGNGFFSDFKYTYKACKPLRKETNILETGFGGLTHLMNLYKMSYNSSGLLKTEKIYDLSDTSIITNQNEYTYKAGLQDTVKEYYYMDGEKLINRYIINFYSGKQLDSIWYQNPQANYTDKVFYDYNANGRLSKITGTSIGNFEYYYNPENDPELIIEGLGPFKYYYVKYE